jgi:Lrp/AsnC family transcriptional regulator, regulator for asnA, asnC and gidA
MNLRTALDETDARIIEELNQDGRRSFAEIARNLAINEATVRHRYARLVRRKIIQVVAVSDALALGLVFAEIGVRVRGGPVANAVATLEKIPEVDYIAVCAGSFDLLIEVVCTDNGHLFHVLDDGVRNAPGVDSIEVFTILDVPKHSYRWTRLLVERDPPG